MAALDGFVLLTATCRSTAVQREHIVAFPLQQRLRKRAKLCTLYVHCLICSLRRKLEMNLSSVCYLLRKLCVVLDSDSSLYEPFV
jgi:hypothetical protein